MSEQKHTPGTGVHPEDMNALTEYWHRETNYINDMVDSAFKSAQDDAYARGYRRGREDLIAIRAQRDSFKDAAEYNKRRAEDAERQRDELLKQVESIAFRIANKEYGHAALDCEEALAGAKGQVPDATKMIGAPATANYPHGSLGEAMESEGGAA